MCQGLVSRDQALGGYLRLKAAQQRNMPMRSQTSRVLTFIGLIVVPLTFGSSAMAANTHSRPTPKVRAVAPHRDPYAGWYSVFFPPLGRWIKVDPHGEYNCS